MQCDVCGKKANEVVNGVVVCKNCMKHGESLTWRDYSPSGKSSLKPIEAERKYYRQSPKKNNPKKCPRCGSHGHTWCGSAANKWWKE